MHDLYIIQAPTECKCSNDSAVKVFPVGRSSNGSTLKVFPVGRSPNGSTFKVFPIGRRFNRTFFVIFNHSKSNCDTKIKKDILVNHLFCTFFRIICIAYPSYCFERSDGYIEKLTSRQFICLHTKARTYLLR